MRQSKRINAYRFFFEINAIPVSDCFLNIPQISQHQSLHDLRTDQDIHCVHAGLDVHDIMDRYDNMLTVLLLNNGCACIPFQAVCHIFARFRKSVKILVRCKISGLSNNAMPPAPRVPMVVPKYPMRLLIKNINGMVTTKWYPRCSTSCQI
mgnify:CR=1 FL=1